MPSRWTDYNASRVATRKTSRNPIHDRAITRFLTHWKNGIFEHGIMDIIVPTFPAGRVPVGPQEYTASPVTLFDPAVRRLRKGFFLRAARVRIGAQCAICSTEDGLIICTPLTLVFQGHLL